MVAAYERNTRIFLPLKLWLRVSLQWRLRTSAGDPGRLYQGSEMAASADESPGSSRRDEVDYPRMADNPGVGPSITRSAFVGTNPTDDSITSSLPVIQEAQLSARVALSFPCWPSIGPLEYGVKCGTKGLAP